MLTWHRPMMRQPIHAESLCFHPETRTAGLRGLYPLNGCTTYVAVRSSLFTGAYHPHLTRFSTPSTTTTAALGRAEAEVQWDATPSPVPIDRRSESESWFVLRRARSRKAPRTQPEGEVPRRERKLEQWSDSNPRPQGPQARHLSTTPRGEPDQPKDNSS